MKSVTDSFIQGYCRVLFVEKEMKICFWIGFASPVLGPNPGSGSLLTKIEFFWKGDLKRKKNYYLMENGEK